MVQKDISHFFCFMHDPSFLYLSVVKACAIFFTFACR